MKMVKWSLIAGVIAGSCLTAFAQELSPQRLTIEEMFALAEQNSKAIKTFSIARSEAQQAVKVAKNDLLPAVDLSLSASFLGDGWIADRNFSNGMNAPMPHFGNNFAIEASQVIYAGGALSGAVAMAQLKEQLAALDEEKNRQEIRFLLVGNYLELYKLKNQAEVYRQNIEQTKHLLRDIRAKQSEGVVLPNDITRYELQLQNLELALTQIENSRIILNNQLITVLGLPQQTLIEVDTTLVQCKTDLTEEAYWQQTAQQSSPLLQQTAVGIDLSKRNEKIIRAERIPSVSVFAGDRLDGPILIEVPTLNKNFNYWYFGVGVKFNIASSYKTGKRNALARLETSRAMEQHALMEDQLQTEVKAAYIRYLESFTTYRTRLKNLELAVQNYEVINNRYLNELAVITDMLDASNSKLSAQLDVANSRINTLFNFYKLKKVSGTL